MSFTMFAYCLHLGRPTTPLHCEFHRWKFEKWFFSNYKISCSSRRGDQKAQLMLIRPRKLGCGHVLFFALTRSPSVGPPGCSCWPPFGCSSYSSHFSHLNSTFSSIMSLIWFIRIGYKIKMFSLAGKRFKIIQRINTLSVVYKLLDTLFPTDYNWFNKTKTILKYNI